MRNAANAFDPEKNNVPAQNTVRSDDAAKFICIFLRTARFATVRCCGEVLFFRIGCVERHRRDERLFARDTQSGIFAEGNTGIGFENRLAAGAQTDVRDVVRRDRIAADWIDLESGIVRMPDAHLQ